ncbi:kinase-like protein [Penicillium canescens]|uniref:non-specific serine/threonine protein kinase n=1 Tax=Penicillium canescens TaxID=5083 RepID=A0AAD6I173_PENCN|nr:kinase-like protein [Penicillium canescens]KAJ6027024.1 kinase-like protein [Penicillium canescens]KAJ6040310.1 kinase-like protein [Penicillium canescens]KAJ6067336.1 kinase-like protein [Penicillium canescens]KAJ6085500.1 kinase-like protein [Penicillium canescens]KAJ6162277.1 kinase-like protein [Penicillium canescens]
MEIVQKNEAFKVNGKMGFSYVQVFVQQDGILYCGKWSNRFKVPKTLQDLQEVRQIPKENRGPEVNTTWSAVYVKRPSLLAYANDNLDTQIAREVDVCEILRQNPHPNIAIYYGYEESHGRVAGVCYKRYTSILLEAVNPGRLDKRRFASSGRELVTDKTISSLEGVLDGIQHLHSISIVHNDINPANIMFDKDGTLVLIDFDSCRYIGESLSSTKTKRTHQWHDPSVDVSLEKNNLDAFQELRIWLIGSADDNYNFV